MEYLERDSEYVVTTVGNVQGNVVHGVCACFILRDKMFSIGAPLKFSSPHFMSLWGIFSRSRSSQAPV